MNIILTALIGIVALVGTFLPRDQSSPLWDDIKPFFGATNFPSSLDSLTNPSGTDSVATVSHSGQHSNANDALEAIEAKVGIGSATPVANTLFSSVATGISGWFTWATTTRLTATNLVATASSSLQNFSFLNTIGVNSTSTQST